MTKIALLQERDAQLCLLKDSQLSQCNDYTAKTISALLCIYIG